MRGLEALPALAAALARDQPIDELEREEERLKEVLRGLLARGGEGGVARALARFQRDLGLLLKYKSYAVKASSPLGYSVFLQAPGEGFSFQRHRTHKTEIFHVLEPSAEASVFLCEHADWVASFEPGRFASWLTGRADDVLERFRFRPEAGDVIVIDTVGVVHSVLGCVLEEYAAISTDMVDRLFDQNEGRAIPPGFARTPALARLRQLAAPMPRRRVWLDGGRLREQPIVPLETDFGWIVPLGETAGFEARHLRLEGGRETGLFESGERAVSLFLLAGAGDLRVGSAAEGDLERVPALPLEQGDAVMIPPDARYRLSNGGAAEMVVAEHRIAPEVALI